MPSKPGRTTICTVSELNRLAKNTLEDAYTGIQVEGEISDLIQHRSGHWYFTLKDDQAQLRAAMFRFSNQQVRFEPENGQQVILTGRLSIYEARGSYQFIAEHMQQAGTGKLQQTFEKLKQQLAAKGLFDAQKKRPLPASPAQIVVITSPQGAALRDIQSTFARRFPAIELILIPVAVQGDDAARQIATAIDLANSWHSAHKHNASRTQQAIYPTPEPDAIIVGRGGGSLEDLWPFNEAGVAYAIHRSQLPIVSAVGHEIDFTIADFAADVRAATPTAAAEMLSPDRTVLQQQLAASLTRLQRTTEQSLVQMRQILHNLHSRLRHPGQRMQQQAQQLDHLDMRLQQALIQRIAELKYQLSHNSVALQQYSPGHSVQMYRQLLHSQYQRLLQSAGKNLDRQRQKWQQLSVAMDIVSPLATLRRGYAVIKGEKNAIVRSIAATSKGEQLTVHLADGKLFCTVEGSSSKSLLDD